MPPRSLEEKRPVTEYVLMIHVGQPAPTGERSEPRALREGLRTPGEEGMGWTMEQRGGQLPQRVLQTAALLS